MLDLLDLVVLSLVTYRLSRFIVLDSLIDGTRDRAYERLTSPDRLSTFRLKLVDLLTCNFCITIWVSAVVCAGWAWIDGHWPGWAFIYVWLAVAAGALLPWAYIDSED